MLKVAAHHSAQIPTTPLRVNAFGTNSALPRETDQSDRLLVCLVVSNFSPVLVSSTILLPPTSISQREYTLFCMLLLVVSLHSLVLESTSRTSLHNRPEERTLSIRHT